MIKTFILINSKAVTGFTLLRVVKADVYLFTYLQEWPVVENCYVSGQTDRQTVSNAVGR